MDVVTLRSYIHTEEDPTLEMMLVYWYDSLYVLLKNRVALCDPRKDWNENKNTTAYRADRY